MAGLAFGHAGSFRPRPAMGNAANTSQLNPTRPCRLQVHHCKELPLPWNPLQRMNAPVLEFDARPSDKVAHRSGHKHLARRSLSGHASSGVDCDAANLAADNLAFPGVQSGSDLKADGLQAIA